jgi:heat shock transcription factor
MLNDSNSQGLIHWSELGDSFFGMSSLSSSLSLPSLLLVFDHERFAREILPRWFKHQNFASFVRQLNMYGFHKIPHLQQGVLLRSDSGDNEYWNFEHEHFRRDQPDMLCLIHRKKGSSNANAQQPQQQGVLQPGQGVIMATGGEEGALDVRDPNFPPQPPATTSTNTSSDVPTSATNKAQVLDIASILQGIQGIKLHQTAISEELNQLKQSNELLWQDSMVARERLQKQEDTVTRIVKFLAGVFGNRRTEGAHAHPGHAGHQGDGGKEEGARNEGAVIPVRSVQRRPGAGVPTANRGPAPRLMIEGAKDTSGKGNTSSVGIVEVDDHHDGDVVDIIVDGVDEDREEDSGTFNNAYGKSLPKSRSLCFLPLSTAFFRTFNGLTILVH